MCKYFLSICIVSLQYRLGPLSFAEAPYGKLNWEPEGARGTIGGRKRREPLFCLFPCRCSPRTFVFASSQPPNHQPTVKAARKRPLRRSQFSRFPSKFSLFFIDLVPECKELYEKNLWVETIKERFLLAWSSFTIIQISHI